MAPVKNNNKKTIRFFFSLSPCSTFLEWLTKPTLFATKSKPAGYSKGHP